MRLIHWMRFISNIYGKQIYIHFLLCNLIAGINAIIVNILNIRIGDILNVSEMGMVAISSIVLETIILLCINICLLLICRWYVDSIVMFFAHKARMRIVDAVCFSTHESISHIDNGKILTNFTSDLGSINSMLSSMLTFFQIPIKIIITLIMMIVLNIKITFIIMPLMIFSLLPTLLSIGKLNNLYETEKKSYSDTVSFVNEILDFIEIVKSYQLESKFLENHLKLLDVNKKDFICRTLWQQFIWTLGRILSVIVNPIIFIASGYLVLKGELSFGTVFSIIYLSEYIIVGLEEFYDILSSLPNAFSSMERIQSLLDNIIWEDNENIENMFNISNNTVFKFDSVSFSYGKLTILKNINLEIKKGERVAIIGQSGCGKSSLFRLMQGLSLSYDGNILFFDENIKNHCVCELRSQLSVVTQDPVIFSGTIKENLLLCKPDATDDELYSACKKACIHEFILSLDNGYETPFTGIKATLSKGQAQRLNIAMAILKNAPVFLLDEPLSGLDTEIADKILENILSLDSDKTIIIILHELKNKQIFSQVINLNEGVTCE